MSTLVTEGDGTASYDLRHTLTRLDPADGSVRAHEEAPSPGEPGAPRPRICYLSGATGEVGVDGERLAIDPLLGGAGGVSPSPDASTLLVPTRAGLLLRYDRA